MMTSKKVVVNAISLTKSADPTYFNNTLKQRLEGGAGSIVTGVSSTEELLEKLISANWEKCNDPDVLKICTCYKTRDIVGKMGIIGLSDLDQNKVGFLDDRKLTGFASFCVEGEQYVPIDFTEMIIGPDGDMWTFFPGTAVRPSTTDSQLCYYYSEIVVFSKLDGKKITVAEARKLGFEYGKIV